jgi:hypothetical protein
MCNFTAVRDARGLKLETIARMAGVDALTVFLFEIGSDLDDVVKVKIVHAFSLLTGHHYNVSDFKQNVRPFTPEKVER